MGGVVHLTGVGAIDDYAGDSVRDSALGEIFHAELHVGGRGVSPEIIFDEEHQAEVLHGGEVQTFVGDAGGLSTVADIGHDRDVASLKTGAESYAGEHRNQIAESGDGRDHVAFFDITEMRGCITAFGGRTSLGHVLHHDVASGEAANQK